eukprot:767231-Hanusia_phi.AAC.7
MEANRRSGSCFFYILYYDESRIGASVTRACCPHSDTEILVEANALLGSLCSAVGSEEQELSLGGGNIAESRHRCALNLRLLGDQRSIQRSGVLRIQSHRSVALRHDRGSGKLKGYCTQRSAPAAQHGASGES